MKQQYVNGDDVLRALYALIFWCLLGVAGTLALSWLIDEARADDLNMQNNMCGIDPTPYIECGYALYKQRVNTNNMLYTYAGLTETQPEGLLPDTLATRLAISHGTTEIWLYCSAEVLQAHIDACWMSVLQEGEVFADAAAKLKEVL